MTEQITCLNFEGNELTTFMHTDGSLWFVASDVCRILGLTNTTDALRRLYDNEKLTYEIPRAGQKRKCNIISESGLYKLIMRSSKPEALRFQDWVTQDVLPKIRRDGGYINVADSREPFEIIKNMALQAERMYKMLQEANTEIKTLKPQAQLFDSFFNAVQEDINFNTMAKLSKFITVEDGCPVGGRMLKDKCIEDNIIAKKDRTPNQFYVNKGYFRVYYARIGNEMKPVTRITPKGQKWLYNRMLKYFNKAA